MEQFLIGLGAGLAVALIVFLIMIIRQNAIK